MSRLPTGTLLLEDRLPYALGSRPRVVLERLGAHQASSVAYTVRADVRGRYPVGPLVIRLTDPFGLCELTRSFPSVDRLTVIPQVVAAARGPAGRRVRGHRRQPRPLGGRARRGRRGDPRVPARRRPAPGALAVHRPHRRADGPPRGAALGEPGDGRARHPARTPTAARARRPASSGPSRRPPASRCTCGRPVTSCAWSPAPGIDVDATEAGGEGAILDTLADVKLTQKGDISALVEQVRRRSDGGLVIGLFGSLTAAEAEVLSGLRGNGATCIGFAIDSSTWVNLTARRPAGGRPRSTRRPRWRWSAAAGGRCRSTHGDTLAALWPAAGPRLAGLRLPGGDGRDRAGM